MTYKGKSKSKPKADSLGSARDDMVAALARESIYKPITPAATKQHREILEHEVATLERQARTHGIWFGAELLAGDDAVRAMFIWRAQPIAKRQVQLGLFGTGADSAVPYLDP